ncbi:prophage CP4-57 regulatory family protein [Synechococcus sp. A18-40]|nr:prophage CP4-57 regulatory family protein [Synechococcus sp. A18-40]
MTALSRTSIYRQIAAGTFPRQIQIGSNQVVWVKQQIEDWIDAKIAAAS